MYAYTHTHTLSLTHTVWAASGAKGDAASSRAVSSACSKLRRTVSRNVVDASLESNSAFTNGTITSSNCGMASVA